MPLCVRSFWGLVLGLQCLSLSVRRISRERALGASARDRRRAPRDQILNPLPVIDAVVRPFVLGFSSWSPVSLAERAEDLTRESPRRLCARSSARSAREALTAFYASILSTTSPCTSVRRKSRPWN